MKPIANTLIPYFFVVSVVFLTSLSPVEAPLSNSGQVKELFIKDLKKFIIQTDQLYKDAKAFVKDTSLKRKLITDFYEARNAYKQIEFLSEFYAPSTCKLINGPFLEKADEDEPSKAPIKPEGFQALEDQLFAADSIDRYAFEELAYRLKMNAQRLFPYVSGYTFVDPNIFAAARLQLVRIMALGITGFDSPAAQNSLVEAGYALRGIKECYKIYIKEKKDSRLLLSIENAEKYLALHTDFESFDRLEFITKHLNTIYKEAVLFQKQTGVGYLSEKQAIKQDAVNIFSPAAWDPHFFENFKNVYNPYTKEQAQLGKLLFFDPVLSNNGQRSCASCHKPENGFSDPNPKSLSLDNKTFIKRNAPSILNSALQAKMFWDGRLFFLEDQVNDVVFSTSELHGDFKEIAVRLRKSDEYKKLFARAFPKTADSNITNYAIIKAISEYERTLISFNSRFDQYVRGDKKAMNKSEIRGFNIFAGKGLCATCHFIPVFNGTVPPLYLEGELEVLGVPEDPKASKLKLDNDLGRAEMTGIKWQNGSFKTPTVRNIALTAPYMHNGAFKTLEEVVDFYNKGGGRGLGLDVPNQTLPFDHLNLTKQEQSDLVAFMKTLTDTSGLTGRPVKLPDMEGVSRKVGGLY